MISETSSQHEPILANEYIDMLEEELRWCIVTLQEVLQHGKRIDASVFDIEGKHAQEVLKRCKWSVSTLTGKDGLAEAFHRPRFKRIWVRKSELPIFQPSQIEEIDPQPSGYLSSLTETDIEALRVEKGQVLLTCSGTLGKCSYVTDTLDGCIFSHDLIRLTIKEKTGSGYLYAFLRTKIGNTLIRTNKYGAVISHIEPEHLENVPIPNPPDMLKERIHNLIVRSYTLRDESNALLDQAEALLYEALKLPPLKQLKPHYFDKNIGLRNYAVKLSDLSGRLDGSYHVPIVDAILKQLEEEAEKLVQIGDACISKRALLPGRFKRVYVQEGAGTVFFGGKQIFELDPSNKKYLSLTKHADRVKKELKLTENMILITRSGTIGKVALSPKHWENWVINEHIIRVEPASNDIAGFLYVFLASDYGRELITRFTYGAVVDEIDTHQVSQIPIPLLKDVETQDKINHLALEANVKRTEAYNLEQDAIRITNEEVIHVTK